MSWLTKIFPSTKGSGFSKKVAVLFVSGTVLPTLYMAGTPDWVVKLLGALSAVYLGGQSVVDASSSFKAKGDK
jgi:hypothetical protein